MQKMHRKSSDEEMRVKIERHREDRPKTWLTVEEPLELARIVAQPRPNCDAIVVDCLTIFAGNLLEATGEDEGAIEQRIKELCDALRLACCLVVLVSRLAAV